MRITIDITDNIMDRALERYCHIYKEETGKNGYWVCNCPIAIAIKEQFKSKVHNDPIKEVQVSLSEIGILFQGLNDYLVFGLTRKALSFISNYDMWAGDVERGWTDKAHKRPVPTRLSLTSRKKS